MIRTHDAGTLRAEHAGTTVTLAGWVARRRDHGGVAFIDLRDASGTVQIVARDLDAIGDLRSEYCVKVTGEIRVRPAGNENPDIATGAVELVVAELEVLSEAAALPFQVAEYEPGTVNEEVRLRYRYLDLRREGPARALRLRSKVNHIIRTVMEENDYLDIETPYLTRSTPRALATSSSRSACSPATGTPCRSPRSSSSSC